jgi:hypothetical protein
MRIKIIANCWPYARACRSLQCFVGSCVGEDFFVEVREVAFSIGGIIHAVFSNRLRV